MTKAELESKPQHVAGGAAINGRPLKCSRKNPGTGREEETLDLR